jgi:hypothetical protein
MTTSFVGAASAEATSLTLPAHQAGDLLIVAAANSAGTAITVPAGWFRLHHRNADGTRSLVVAYKIATTAAEVSGTWTNANVMCAAVYRDDTNYITIGGMRFSGATSSASLFYGPLTATGDAPGLITPSQWVIAVGMTGSNAGAAETAPTGFTNRVSQAGATVTELAIHDTDATVASVGSLSVTLGVTTASMSVVASIEDIGVSKSAAGMLIHPGMSGGMRG